MKKQNVRAVFEELLQRDHKPDLSGFDTETIEQAFIQLHALANALEQVISIKRNME